jgi:hypothetical protein
MGKQLADRLEISARNRGTIIHADAQRYNELPIHELSWMRRHTLLGLEDEL